MERAVAAALAEATSWQPPDDPYEALLVSRARREQLAAGWIPPAGVRVEQVEAGGVPADLVGELGDTAVLYLHGGAYVSHSPRTHRPITAQLHASAGCAVLVPDYRLAPEHPHPAALEDALAALDWLHDQGVQPSAVVLAGDSAGGGLALAVALAVRGTPRAPAGCVLLSPWVDLTLATPSAVEDSDELLPRVALSGAARAYAAGLDLRLPALSPLFADLTGLPPLHIEVGGAELLLDDSVLLARSAQDAGVPVALEVAAGLPHVFQAHLGTPEATASFERIGAFVRTCGRPPCRQPQASSARQR